MRFLVLWRTAGSGWQVAANHKAGCLPECVEHGWDTAVEAGRVLNRMLDADERLSGLVVQVHQEWS